MILIKPTTTNIGPLRHGTVKIGPLPNRTANMIRNGMPGASGVATNPNLPPPILSPGGIHLPPKSLHPTNATPPQNINPFPNLLQLIQVHTNGTLPSPLHWARSANLPNTNIGKIIERFSHPRQMAALVSPYKMTHKRDWIRKVNYAMSHKQRTKATCGFTPEERPKPVLSADNDQFEALLQSIINISRDIPGARPCSQSHHWLRPP